MLQKLSQQVPSSELSNLKLLVGKPDMVGASGGRRIRMVLESCTLHNRSFFPFMMIILPANIYEYITFHTICWSTQNSLKDECIPSILRKENDNHLNGVLKEAIQSWASDFHLTSIDSNSDPGNEQE